MNWRPDGWDKGECEGCKRRIDDEFGEFFCDISCGEHRAQVNYEAGADAMLEELRRLGNSRGGREDNEYRNGTWIFLSDEMTGYVPVPKEQ